MILFHRYCSQKRKKKPKHTRHFITFKCHILFCLFGLFLYKYIGKQTFILLYVRTYTFQMNTKTMYMCVMLQRKLNEKKVRILINISVTELTI